SSQITLWIPCGSRGPGGEQVHDQQVNATPEQFEGFVHETAQAMPVTLVPKRDDLHHGHDSVAAGMTNGNYFGLRPVNVDLGAGVKVDWGRCRGQCNSSTGPPAGGAPFFGP